MTNEELKDLARDIAANKAQPISDSCAAHHTLKHLEGHIDMAIFYLRLAMKDLSLDDIDQEELSYHIEGIFPPLPPTAVDFLKAQIMKEQVKKQGDMIKGRGKLIALQQMVRNLMEGKQ